MQIQSIMRKYGRKITLHLPNAAPSAPFFGFVQALRYKNKMYLYGVNTEIGYNSQGHYLYIGPPTHDLRDLPDDTFLQLADKRYQIDRAEGVYLAGKLLYIWAIIRTIEQGDAL